MDMSAIMQEFVAELIRLGIAKPDEIQGCTDEEIEEIRVKQGVSRLPQIYIEIMRTIGRKTECLFYGDGFYYKGHTYLDMKETALEILKKSNASFQLPEDAFVFLWHPNYIFFYFHTDNDDDNPPLYRFMQGYTEPAAVESLMSLLLAELLLCEKVANSPYFKPHE